MTLQDGDGEVVMSGIHTYGDTVHLFIERKNYHGAFMPGSANGRRPITRLIRSPVCRPLRWQRGLE